MNTSNSLVINRQLQPLCLQMMDKTDSLLFYSFFFSPHTGFSVQFSSTAQGEVADG